MNLTNDFVIKWKGGKERLEKGMKRKKGHLHLLRKIKKVMDFDLVYALVEDKYSTNQERPSIDQRCCNISLASAPCARPYGIPK